MAAVALACGSIGKKTFTQEVFKEARIVGKLRGSTFLSGKDKKLKAQEEAIKRKQTGPSPPQERPMFWT